MTMGEGGEQPSIVPSGLVESSMMKWSSLQEQQFGHLGHVRSEMPCVDATKELWGNHPIEVTNKNSFRN